MNDNVKSDVMNIAKLAKEYSQKGLPPVHLWNPDFCGDIDMRIARDGTWYYLGTPIGRRSLVKLFSSIIRKDGDDYFLVTPVEKVGIRVDDAPFVAIDFNVIGKGKSQNITFTTQVDDQVLAGKSNPIHVKKDSKTGEPSPYILIRTNLVALIDRKSFYRLVDLAVQEKYKGEDWFGVWSDGVFFPITALKDLD